MPQAFLPKKKNTVGFTQYGFTKCLTLYKTLTLPKPNKAVLLISSMHNQKGFDDYAQKPEIISYYNSTKGGVDALDEKCSIYSTGRRTRRWLLAIFYRLLDISSLNSYVLYNSFKNNKTMTRADFLKSLGFELVSPELERCFENTCILREIRSGVESEEFLVNQKTKKIHQYMKTNWNHEKLVALVLLRRKRKLFTNANSIGIPHVLSAAEKFVQIVSEINELFVF